MPHDFNPEPEKSPPPVLGIGADIGLGKTRAWRERVAAVLVASGKHPILAVPRHRLGDENVRDLGAVGMIARVYRGRDALDPDADDPGTKMCRDIERVVMIEGALGSAASHACRYRDRECEFFNSCGYQRQRAAEPDVWVVPHQLLFRRRPSFIPAPSALAIDEAFWSAGLRGLDTPYRVSLDALTGDRSIPREPASTADLVEISRSVHDALAGEPEGRVRRAALVRIPGDDLRLAWRLEWRRKLELDDVLPGAPIEAVNKVCARVAEHNRLVAKLARLWMLLARTIEAPEDRSPWVELRRDERPGTDAVMAWREDIHADWRAPTIAMDATLPTAIVRQFLPGMEDPLRVAAPMPHARVRQITDRPMAASMLIPTVGASEETNATRRANIERLRRFIEVRAADVRPGRVLVICQKGLEDELITGPLPVNVDVAHFNNVAGLNDWSNVALLIVVGRTEPSPGTVERTARALFGTEIAEVPLDDKGAVRYPQIVRGIRLRDGTGAAVPSSQHPDPRAEEVRLAICESGLVQAIGRGRGVNRTAVDPLLIDILTNVVLPIEVDDLTTWPAIQPGYAEIMRARGAVPLSYADMATAYPDLFPSLDAARMALGRENPEQTPIEKYLIGVCSGFLAVLYRRAGTRGPAGRLLYDATRMDPREWLTAKFGSVTVLS